MSSSLLQPRYLIISLGTVALVGVGSWLKTDSETASDPMTRPAIACAALSQAFTEYFARYAPDDLPEPDFAQELSTARTYLGAMMGDMLDGVPGSGDFHENVLQDARNDSRQATDLAAAQVYVDATWPELQACAETTLTWWRSE